MSTQTNAKTNTKANETARPNNKIEQTVLAVQTEMKTNALAYAVESAEKAVYIPSTYDNYTDSFKTAFKRISATARLTEKFNLDNCKQCFIMKKELTTTITDSKARTKAFEQLYTDLGTDRSKFNRYCVVYDKILSNEKLSALTKNYSISALIELSTLTANQLAVLFGIDDRTCSKNYAEELSLSTAPINSDNGIKTVIKSIKDIELDTNVHNTLNAILNYYLNNGKYDCFVDTTKKKDKDKDKDKDKNSTTTTTNTTAIDVLLTLGDKAFENVDKDKIKKLADLVTKAYANIERTIAK